MKVVTLNQSNFRQVPETLRVIADEIAEGKSGQIGCAVLVVLGNTMEVYAMGPDSDAASAGMLLHAGFMRMSKAIEEHGKE